MPKKRFRFMDRTSSLAHRKRKALLDGILFEIFFNSEGKLRDDPKIQRFNEVFRLQQFAELKSSFDFIAECLVTDAGRFARSLEAVYRQMWWEWCRCNPE